MSTLKKELELEIPIPLKMPFKIKPCYIIPSQEEIERSILTANIHYILKAKRVIEDLRRKGIIL